MITIVRKEVAPPPIEKVIMEFTPEQAAFIKWLTAIAAVLEQPHPAITAANSLYTALKDITTPVNFNVRF